MTAHASDQTKSITARDQLTIALAAAVLTGLIEFGIGWFRQAVLTRMVFTGPDGIWLAPLGYALEFALLVAPLLLYGLARPISIRPAIGLVGFVGAFSLSLSFPGVAHLAGLVLSFGIAFQLARSAGRRPPIWLARARRIARLGTALVMTLGIGVGAIRWIGERRRAAALGPEPNGPNVLLIVLDTVRRPNLSLYGYARPTSPELDRRAREGAVFDQAYSTAPWTLPSHVTMFTGQYPHAVTGDWLTPHDGRAPTLAQRFAERGYRTAGFVANLLYTSRESGITRGFVHYRDYPISFYQLAHHTALGRTVLFLKLSESRSAADVARAIAGFDLSPGQAAGDEYRPADRIADEFLAWEARDSRPFFGFLNLFDAHGPYRSPEEFRARFRTEVKGAGKLDAYDAAIAFVDQQLGRLLSELERRGVLDRTLVVITSDHGEHFGEHGLKGHANSLYLPLLAVPLYIRYPASVPSGWRGSRIVSLKDLAATILDLAGDTSQTAIPGASLARQWRDSASVARPLLAELSRGINVDSTFPNSKGPMTSLIDDSLHYIKNGWGREELYRYRADPEERDNLVERVDSSILARFRTTIDSLRKTR